MKELVDQYAALAHEHKERAALMADIKKELLEAWGARPLEDHERNTLRGMTNILTVVVATSNRFDKKKFELNKGKIHPAYFKASTSTSLRST